MLSTENTGGHLTGPPLTSGRAVHLAGPQLKPNGEGGAADLETPQDLETPKDISEILFRLSQGQRVRLGGGWMVI